jgi:transposase-like protein
MRESDRCHAHAGAGDAGRPDGLTPEIHERICAAIRAGAYSGEAARRAGIARSTCHRWLERGEADDAPERFQNFAAAVREAETGAELDALRVISSAFEPTYLHSPCCEAHYERYGERECAAAERRGRGEGQPHLTDVGCEVVGASWKAAVAFLERRFPERWRRQASLEHTGGNPDKPVRISAELLTDPRVREAADALKRRVADARKRGPGSL